MAGSYRVILRPKDSIFGRIRSRLKRIGAHYSRQEVEIGNQQYIAECFIRAESPLEAEVQYTTMLMVEFLPKLEPLLTDRKGITIRLDIPLSTAF